MANKDRVGHGVKKTPAHDLKERKAARREAKRERKASTHGKRAHRTQAA